MSTGKAPLTLWNLAAAGSGKSEDLKKIAQAMTLSKRAFEVLPLSRSGIRVDRIPFRPNVGTLGTARLTVNRGSMSDKRAKRRRDQRSYPVR